MLDRTLPLNLHAPIPAEPLLIHASGALDHDAIAAEIERRMEGRKPWQRDMIEAKVMEVASQQRWPLLDAAVQAEWTSAERAEFDRLSSAAWAQSISVRGNATYSDLRLQAEAIQSRVARRAAEKMIAPAHAHAPPHPTR